MELSWHGHVRSSHALGRVVVGSPTQGICRVEAASPCPSASVRSEDASDVEMWSHAAVSRLGDSIGTDFREIVCGEDGRRRSP